jgi:prephenate dehydrogenase
MLVERMTVCGVGLIGGSVALGARRRGLAREVVGFDRTRAHLDFALSHGLISRAVDSPAAAAQGAQLVVLATPLLAMPKMLAAMVPHLPEDAVITDTGSVKAWVVHKLAPLLRGPMALVPAHPVAGKELDGPKAAEASLFEGRRVIVTPTAQSGAEGLRMVEGMYRALGARVETMDARTHDRLLARSSHLPQLAASALALAIGQARVGDKLVFDYGAGGLRDTTRLALSPAEMWRDICLTNREAILEALALYRDALDNLEQLIERGDAQGLEVALARGRQMREQLK